MGSSILTTVGSLLAGGAVAGIAVVGLVTQQTSAGANPTDVNKPVVIDYGTNS